MMSGYFGELPLDFRQRLKAACCFEADELDSGEKVLPPPALFVAARIRRIRGRLTRCDSGIPPLKALGSFHWEGYRLFEGMDNNETCLPGLYDLQVGVRIVGH
jgi:hypothetical protein